MNDGPRAALLLTTLTLLFVLAGRAAGGTEGMVIAFVLALLMNFSTYWFSDRIALSMVGAREISPERAPDLHRMVEQLAILAGLPKPRVYVMESASPNAFATGRDPAHSAVAVTTGIQRILTRDELEGVLSHELAHVRNRDTLISAFVATMAGTITMIAGMGRWALMFGGFGRSDSEEGEGGIADLAGSILMILVAPIAATFIQLAVSRAREYGADALGARILGDPLPLARALEKLEIGNRALPMKVNPATAHQFIVQPLAGGGMMRLFSTHPPVEERVRRLSEMALGPISFL